MRLGDVAFELRDMGHLVYGMMDFFFVKILKKKVYRSVIFAFSNSFLTVRASPPASNKLQNTSLLPLQLLFYVLLIHYTGVDPLLLHMRVCCVG